MAEVMQLPVIFELATSTGRWLSFVESHRYYRVITFDLAAKINDSNEVIGRNLSEIRSLHL